LNLVRLRRTRFRPFNGSVALIDDALPSYDVHEVHSITCTRTLDEALATPLAADPIVRALLRLRGIRTDGTIADLFVRLRFEEVARDEDEVVFAGAAAPWRGGTVRIAMNFRREGSTLSTETRVQAVDDEARRVFLRYWRVIGPFSALIRRRWLKQIAA
jgi:hypothetical protein